MFPARHPRMSHPVAPSPFCQSRLRFISLAAVGFPHDFAPEAEGVGLVEVEIQAEVNSAPFAPENLPGGVGGGGRRMSRGPAALVGARSCAPASQIRVPVHSTLDPSSMINDPSPTPRHHS